MDTFELPEVRIREPFFNNFGIIAKLKDDV
jgi:hypothetical protein